MNLHRTAIARVSERRVLIVVQNLPVPYDRRVWLEATTLAHHGCDVSVICPKAKGFNRSRERIENVEIYRYPTPTDSESKLSFFLEFIWCFLATTVISLWVAIYGRGFDILHVCNPPDTYWPLGLMYRMFGRVFVFDHHDLSPELASVKFNKHGGFLISALLKFESLTFRAAQVVITTNESLKRVAVERGGKRVEEIFVVRSGPDLSRFKIFDSDSSFKHEKAYLLAYLGK
jgi:glycosyltransferase involved in cell wall biosynthesis